MAELTDNEELERLKQWWRESGKQTLGMIVLVVAGYFGWQGWQDHKQLQAYAASEIYDKMVEAAGSEDPLNAEQKATVTHLAVTLVEKHGGSQYGHYARLLLARLAVEDGDLEPAADYLLQVADGADEGLSLIARLRLAKVEVERGDTNTALQLLNVDEPETLAASYAEARGDVHVAAGNGSAAVEFYDKALATLPADQQRFQPLLEMKRLQAGLPVSEPDGKEMVNSAEAEEVK